MDLRESSEFLTGGNQSHLTSLPPQLETRRRVQERQQFIAAMDPAHRDYFDKLSTGITENITRSRDDVLRETNASIESPRKQIQGQTGKIDELSAW